MQSPQLSIVIPVYNEQDSLPELYNWIKKVVTENQLSSELLFVDDGSTDDSWKYIEKISIVDPTVKGIRFTRNYGKSAALDTGFSHACGNVVITMDSDLQDSPEEIPDLYKMIASGEYHMVSGWKKKRHDPISKTIPSKFFNWVTSKVSGIKLHDFNCGLKAYDIRLVKSLHLYGEMHRYIPLLAKWNGFNKIGEKVVQHRARKYGVTKFGFERYLNGFLDLLSVSFVTRFRRRPMHFFGLFGTLSFLSGFALATFIIAEKLYNQYHGLPVRDVVNQPLFFIGLVALLVGVQLFLVGFLAEMVTQVNAGKRDYLIAERTNS